MNTQEAKSLTLPILDRWRWLGRDKVHPRFVVIKTRGTRGRSDPVAERIFADAAMAQRYADTQINPNYYSIVRI